MDLQEKITEIRKLIDSTTKGPFTVEGGGGIQMSGTRDYYSILAGRIPILQSSLTLLTSREQRRDYALLVTYVLNSLPELLDAIEDKLNEN